MSEVKLMNLVSIRTSQKGSVRREHEPRAVRLGCTRRISGRSLTTCIGDDSYPGSLPQLKIK